MSIGTIGLIKAVTTFDPSKGARLATYASRCIENEILMYFRSRRKSAQDVSLSDCIETGTEGAALSLVAVDTLQKAKTLPGVFNNWAVFYGGKFVTVNQIDGAMAERLIKRG